MKNIACKLEHSVKADVTTSFAWSWRTDIKNWDDPPAQFQLDGPFASGSWGRTLLPGQEIRIDDAPIRAPCRLWETGIVIGHDRINLNRLENALLYSSFQRVTNQSRFEP
jgi:hypothetical protein